MRVNNIPENSCDPSTWDAYSFEKLASTPNTLTKKEKIWHAIVSTLSLVIYFGITGLLML